MLDVGCGSGILGLAALASSEQGSAVGIDLDPEAVSRHQGQRPALNGLEPRGGAQALTPLEEVAEAFPLVLANMLASELAELAEPLAGHLSPGGELVISGILVDQIQDMTELFASLGLKVVEQDSLADGPPWCWREP